MHNKQTPNSKHTIPNIQFPAIALLISGGHTELVLVKQWGEYELLGQTRDDAVGEAFDKVARLLGLPYPGGPGISRLAEQARNSNLQPITYNLQLPRPMIDSPDYDFSFSGLKTAVLYFIREHERQVRENPRVQAELAREFEDAVADVLVAKTKKALNTYDIKTLIVAGGVIANKHLRTAFKTLLTAYPNTKLLIPPLELTGDNAVMIGIVGYLTLLQNKTTAPKSDARAQGNLKLTVES